MYNNINPEAKMPFVTDADGVPFDEPWWYFSAVGVLIYLSSNSMSSIQFAVHQCTRFIQNPSRSHHEAVKMILCFLFGTQEQGITFDPNIGMKLD